MDRDEEKDLYIKEKLKDGNIPEKIDNLFNNSAKLVNENNKLPHKNLVILKRVAATAACAVIILGGGNIYATTQGYENVFFMIKEWINPSKDVYGKDEILSDRDITISYKSIEVAKGIKMQINRLVVKDNEAKLHLKVDQAETKLNITPFTYVVRDENGTEICNYASQKQELMYNEELVLNGLNKDAKYLELEVKQNDDKTLVKFKIDLENKEIEVIGNEYELQKISEEELKKYLSAFALLNYEDDELNSGVIEKDILIKARSLMVANQIGQINNYKLENLGKANLVLKSFSDVELNKSDLNEFKDLRLDGTGLCIDVADIMYSNGIYTVTFTYCYPTTEDINENRIEDLPIYEMTIGLTINESETYSKYRVSSKLESKLIKSAKETNKQDDMIQILPKCKETLEKYLLLLGSSEGAPESVLQELNIMTYQEFEKLRQNGSNIQGEYVKTTYKFQDFKNLMLKYMTEELYIQKFDNKYKDISGFLGVHIGGATGISFEIKEMEFVSNSNDIYTYKVVYIEEPSDGKEREMKVNLKYANENYVVSNIEYEREEQIAVDDMKKFIGEWKLEYAIGNYGYEQELKNLYGGYGVTLIINEDGTFKEIVQDTEMLMGNYTKINENTIKRTYENGVVTYTTYETNALGETVISNQSKINQSITEYYSQKDVDIYETKDYFVGNWWRTTYNGVQEEFKYMISIRSDGQFLIVKDNKIEEKGIYKVEDDGETVPSITLKFNDGNEKQLNLQQGSESYLVNENLTEQYQYYYSVG